MTRLLADTRAVFDVAAVNTSPAVGESTSASVSTIRPSAVLSLMHDPGVTVTVGASLTGVTVRVTVATLLSSAVVGACR